MDHEIVEGGDLEIIAREKIIKLLEAQFKGKNLVGLVEAILIAQGYTTWRNPEGLDRIVDILAGRCFLGVGPRACVTVASQSAPMELKSLNLLYDAIQESRSREGILVSWNGFENSIYSKVAQGPINIQLWAINEVLEQLISSYDQLEDNLKAKLPLKQIWTVETRQ
ncbi:MAG: restriction endonuclease [Syntrophales bacterium]|jgi:restriction system protein|nr:restriction endonuclease [Syntrophales bacterium]MCK9392352.1 restriction endonuclease [Syntrophales bacterium]